MTDTPDDISRDITVLRYIDGDRSPAIIDALRRMSDAPQRIADLGGIHNRIVGSIYRALCPDTLTLADYTANLLLPADQQRIAAHVADCASCLPEVETMRRAARDIADTGPLPLADQVRRLLHAVKLSLGGTAAQPAFAVRDLATADAPTLYTIGDDIEISLSVRPDTARPGTRNLFGQISDFAQPNQWAGATVRLVTRATGALVAQTTTDADGIFVFPARAPGIYGISITGTATNDLVVDDVQI